MSKCVDSGYLTHNFKQLCKQYFNSPLPKTLIIDLKLYKHHFPLCVKEEQLDLIRKRIVYFFNIQNNRKYMYRTLEHIQNNFTDEKTDFDQFHKQRRNVSKRFFTFLKPYLKLFLEKCWDCISIWDSSVQCRSEFNNSNEHIKKILQKRCINESKIYHDDCWLNIQDNTAKTFSLKIPDNVVQHIHEKIPFTLDAFSNAVNAYDCIPYCSPYNIEEEYFGSKGNFFDQKELKGFVLVKPPRVNEIIQKTIQHILTTIQTTRNELGYLLFTPSWSDTTYCRKILKSSFLKGKELNTFFIFTTLKGYSFRRSYNVFFLANPRFMKLFYNAKKDFIDFIQNWRQMR